MSKKPKRLKHGIYARDLVLPWEDLEEYASLHDRLCSEYFPNGASEEELVLDLTQAYWQKRTLWRMRTAAAARDPFTAEIVATGGKTWPAIRKALRDNAREDRSSRLRVETVLAEAFMSIQNSAAAGDQSGMSPAFVKTLELLREQVLPLVERLTQTGPEEAFDNAYAPDVIERLVNLEAQLDTRITKLIARLIGIKEFKRTPAGKPPAELPR